MSFTKELLDYQPLNLKVQIIGGASTKAILTCGEPKPGEALTFHAFSDRMKSSILESIAKGSPIVVTVCDDPPRVGEWFEPLARKPSFSILKTMMNEPFEKND